MRDQAANIRHRQLPEVGDYWHEMLTPILVVVAALPRHVVVCREKKSVSAERWTWALDKLEIFSRPDFSKYLTYKTMPDKTWCDVLPRHMP